MSQAAPAAIAARAADLRADTGNTIATALRHINDFLAFNLIDIQGMTLSIGALIGAVLTVLIALVISKVLRVGLDRYARQHQNKNNQAALYTLSRIIHYILLVIGALLALSVAGIPLSKFGLFAGALGVGLGFGLQAIFSNFVSGLIILFDRSLKVGDFVELSNGVHGHVNDIHIRATRITTNDNIDILVPNSEFVTNNVVNWTLRETSRRMRIPFRAAYGVDKELVKRAALEAAAEVPFTLTLDGPRKPQVWLTGFGDSWLNFALVVWLNDDAVVRPATVNAACNWALHSALERHGIQMPFPHRDLDIKSWPEHTGDGRSFHQSNIVAQAAEAHAREPVVAAENDAARDIVREREEQGRDTSRTLRSPPSTSDGEHRERD